MSARNHLLVLGAVLAAFAIVALFLKRSEVYLLTLWEIGRAHV